MQFSALTGFAVPFVTSRTFGPSFLHSITQWPQPRQRVELISGMLPLTNFRPKASAICVFVS
jgi:hypothetical protein